MLHLDVTVVSLLVAELVSMGPQVASGPKGSFEGRFPGMAVRLTNRW